MKFQSGDIVRYLYDDELVGIVIEPHSSQNNHNIYNVMWFTENHRDTFQEWEYELKEYTND
jgi:hypothetical protein